MKQILLPTDFSENAWNAIFFALKLYASVPCKFHLLHVYEPKTKNLVPSRSSTRAGILYESMAEESKKGLNETLAYLVEHHKNTLHSFEIISEQKDIVTAIKELIQKHDIHLVAMGTKGATGAKEIFMGSTTVKVLKAVQNRTIIAVPSPYNFQSLKKIAFPTAYTHPFLKSALAPMMELIQIWDPKIYFLHVAQEFSLTETQQVHREKLKTHFGDHGHSFHNVSIKSTVASAINDFSEEIKADMVVLTHYQHTFMEKLTQEPVIKKVGFHCKIPLMILPEYAQQ